MTQMVKNLPAMQETQVQSLGQEDPLEKGMATHSFILAWEIPCTEELGGPYSPWGPKRVGHDLSAKQQQLLVSLIHSRRGLLTQNESALKSHPYLIWMTDTIFYFELIPE